MTNYAHYQESYKSGSADNGYEKEFRGITKWLKKSGPKVNGEKTKIYLFHRQFQGNVIVEVNGITIKS